MQGPRTKETAWAVAVIQGIEAAQMIRKSRTRNPGKPRDGKAGPGLRARARDSSALHRRSMRATAGETARFLESTKQHYIAEVTAR